MVSGSEKWPGFTPLRATALRRRSVAYYCTAAYTWTYLGDTKNMRRYRKDSWLRREDSNLRLCGPEIGTSGEGRLLIT
jgi:hypothetical protein